MGSNRLTITNTLDGERVLQKPYYKTNNKSLTYLYDK